MAVAETSKLSAWYTATGRAEPAGDVFKDALHAFSAELSNDAGKLRWIVDSKFGNIEAVLESVMGARERYEGRKGDSQVREALVSFSEKIHHYGGIMDVLVSHHPEYTALVWGAMKFLFVGVVNHHKIITQLSVGLSEIADILPRAELISRLYPVPHMKKIVVAIYSHILRFLVRALRWYQESKFMHVVHSITRPTELRYDDILDNISTLSRSMSDTAMASSQAEQRDMHMGILQNIQGQEILQSSLERQKKMLEEIITAMTGANGERRDTLAAIQQLLQTQGDVRSSVEQMNATLLDFMASQTTERVIYKSANVELRQQVSDVQLAQFLDHISVSQLFDPLTGWQKSLFLAKKRRIRSSTRGPAFWVTDKIQRWNSSCTSSLVIVNGTRNIRFHLQEFCAESVSILRESKIPAIWALKTVTPENATTNGVSPIELIKYLISQAITVNESIHTDADLTPCIKSFTGAKSEDDWINILGSVLQGIPHLYTILDIEVLSQSNGGPSNGFWPAAFLSIFAELSKRGVMTVIKVILVSYGSVFLKGPHIKSCEDCVVTLRQARQTESALTRLPRRGKGASGFVGGDRLDFTCLAANGSQSRFRKGKRLR